MPWVKYSIIGACCLFSLPGALFGAPAARVPTPPYLRMPDSADGKIPALLSQTGVFADTASLKVSKGLIPYDLIVAFWSDGAEKTRYAAIPKGQVRFNPDAEWQFPAGTVFVKTFELPIDDAHPAHTRRLETRLLVRARNGGVYGVDYKWRADGSDADLLTGSRTEAIPIRAANGEVRTQSWYYPSRQDCLTCHTSGAGFVLGLKTRQLNRTLAYPSGAVRNELLEWDRLGLFTPRINQAVHSYPTLAAADDTSRSLEDRARSYLDANCSHCHRPNGTVANFDARYTTALEAQALIEGPVLIDQGIDRPRVISPHDIWRSIAYMRVATNDDIRMPPLARETIDVRGVALLREWIESLPGREVLAPPSIAPAGGNFTGSVNVSLTANEPGAEVRYTLDGSVPGPGDALYTAPIRLSGAAVLRARAFKNGFTRSITTQQVFEVNP
jgi:uncharacterized repeat protein (TIGR03806 family)